MQASSSLPAITYSSSVLFPSSGGTSSAHTSKREARAAAHTTRATPEAWSEVKGLAKQSNTHLEQTEAKERALAELSRRASRRSTRKNSETGRAQKVRRASAVQPR